MQNNLNIDKILNKELSRKEFLGLVGAGVVSVIGVSAILKNFGVNLDKRLVNNNSSVSYGQSLYGGDKSVKL